jgi:hypothetical protein
MGGDNAKGMTPCTTPNFQNGAYPFHMTPAQKAELFSLRIAANPCHRDGLERMGRNGFEPLKA